MLQAKPRKYKGLDMELLDLSTVLEETKQVIRQCFKQFELNEVFLSFNGGKDCTVLLELTIELLKEIYKRDDIAKDLKVVYIRTKGPFKEIEDFVQHVKEFYKVNLIITEGDMKETLQKLLDEDKNLKACLMGTRRTDPYSAHLNFMQKTDPSWPQIVRVFPLLNWQYHEIWSYILEHRIPYCSLYDKGYTSIGSTADTRANPELTFIDNHNHCHALPAWMLSDGALERAGRGAPKPKQPKGILKCSKSLDDKAKQGSLEGSDDDSF